MWKNLGGRDLLKIGQLYLNDGNWKGKQLVSANWVKKSTTPKVKIDDKTEYGYLWWISEFDNEKAFYMTGTGGNKVVVLPKLNSVIVITSTYFNGGMKAHIQTDELLNDYILPGVKRIINQLK